MKDSKIRSKSQGQTKLLTKEINDRLDLLDKEMGLKLQTLDSIFAQSKDYPAEFHQLYVQPLLDADLTLEDSFSLLVDGVLRPN